ncbi:MAG: nitroreductase [Deltaproteobacteria bacterium]|nr:nitroreductase [Deltaproteobacteria bacterium]
MEFFQCIEGRRSYRAFLEKDVDRAVLEKVMGAANRSPSYRNSQPWEVFIVAGEKRDRLAERLTRAAISGETPSSALPTPKEWPGALSKRMEEHTLLRLRAIGIDPDDEGKVRESGLRNYRFYDAPCAIFVGMHGPLAYWSVYDLGSFVHGILLSLEAQGLGGCPQASVTRYGNIIKEELSIPEEIEIIIAISVGYPDPDAPVNAYKSKRREEAEFVRWYGL